jgi:hypothetical protein
MSYYEELEELRMFEFFEGLIENLGLKLVSDFTDKLFDFIKNSKNKDKDGDSAQIGSSGYSAQIGSSGNYAQIGSSGDSAQIGSSGYSAQIGSSGNYAQIGSSGNYAQIGSSGYSAQIDISGNYAVGFACGRNSMVKAKKGTWISLCEYKRNNEGFYIPTFALSAQIGNKEYTDVNSKELSENDYYCLFNKKFHAVDISDGICLIKTSEKKKGDLVIIKGEILGEQEKIYVVKENGLNAHGETLKEAMNDLLFKKLKRTEVSEIVAEIKKTNKVTKIQYRTITGACQFGTNDFCKKHNIKTDSVSLNRLRKILVNDYGADKFWSLIDGESL